MFEHRIAYRHDTGEVEGFKGTGFTAEAALEDAQRQIIIKCEHYITPARSFNRQSVIHNDNGLTPKEMEEIRQDWHSKARYHRET